MHQINRHLAETLKTLRRSNGWSLDKTATATGVSKAMLGQIERGESSPTVATLWKIAGGFNVSLSSFMLPFPDQEQDAKVRSADQIRHQPATDEMLVATLFPFDPRFGFELFELTLLPGYERRSAPHETGVTEHVTVISGTMELLINDQWQTLEQGSAIRFAADQPHGYRNCTEQPAIFHNLIHYASSQVLKN